MPFFFILFLFGGEKVLRTTQEADLFSLGGLRVLLGVGAHQYRVGCGVVAGKQRDGFYL